MLERTLHRVTAALLRRRYLVLVLWAIPLPLFLYGFIHVGPKLKTVIGSNPQAESSVVKRELAAQFSKQAEFVGLITIHHDTLQFDSPEFKKASLILHAELKKVRCVKRRITYHDLPIRSLFISKNGKTQAVVLEIDAPVGGFQEGIECIKAIRVAMGRAKQKITLPGLEILSTGPSAIDLDVSVIFARDSFRSELVVVIVSLFLLVWMFRSASGALLPLISSGIAVMMCLSVVFIVADYMRLSIYVSTVSTMTGLGIGLDYALLYVTRFREQLDAGEEPIEAICHTARTAGKAVLGSGCLVTLGFAGLMIPNAGFARSVGVAGMTIVVCTLITTLTLLPVLLSFWHRTLAWPQWRWFRRSHDLVDAFWKRWARLVLRRPFFALAIGGLIVGLGAPHLFRIKTINPRHEVIPLEVEARRGVDRLIEVTGRGQMYPLKVIFELTDGGNWKDPKRRKILLAAFEKVRKWSIVDRVNSVDVMNRAVPGGKYLFGFAGGYAARYLSDNGRLVSADVMAVRVDDRTLDELVIKLRRELPGLVKEDPGIRVKVGGRPAMSYETKTILFGALPWMVLCVVLTALIIMGFFFRSMAIPIKAVIFNALSLSTTYGLLVIVFQYGYGLNLLGVDKGQGALTFATPIILFCVLFGVSMDYEVFLVSRIQEAYRKGMTHREAIFEGLSKTGGIITNAAGVMILAFGAFVSGTLLPMKEIGFALALAVALDATLVRMILVPAVLRLLGPRITWFWPGEPYREPGSHEKGV